MATDTKSRQPRAKTSKDISPFFWTILDTFTDENAMPEWGARGRDKQLRIFAKAEPILAGAVAVMTSKATTLDWQIAGGKSRVTEAQSLLSEAEDGEGWSYWLDRFVQDYTVCDIGGFCELAREFEGGPVSGLYNLDACNLQLTGNVEVPVRYYPTVGDNKSIPLAPGDFFRSVDMPSSEERKFGLGFSAVSRAYKAIRILMALYQYEDEQLSDLPPQGIASITGMTMPEVKEAFQYYQSRRDMKEQLTFKGVLWLAATANPMANIGVDLTPFSTLPAHFNKEEALRHYVYTLALDFGVDVREFWPASQTGATQAEAEVQHQKAKGKGFGRMMSTVERAINWEVLPEGLEFLFDQQDSHDDLLRYDVKLKAVEVVRKLWEPGSGGASPSQLRVAPMPSQPSTNFEEKAVMDSMMEPGMKGIISTEEARRMLVEDGVLPNWLSSTQQTVAHSIEEKALRAKVEKARLKPGEDFVSINRNGEMVTIWSSRSIYSIPLPMPNLLGVAKKEGDSDYPFLA